MLKIFDNWEEFGIRLGQLVAKAWLDPEFEISYVKNPKEALKTVGLSVGDNVEIQIDRSAFTWSVIAPIEKDGGKNVAILSLPMPPRPNGVTDEDLHQMERGTYNFQNLCITCACL